MEVASCGACGGNVTSVRLRRPSGASRASPRAHRRGAPSGGRGISRAAGGCWQGEERAQVPPGNHRGAYFQDEDEAGNKRLGAVPQQDFGAATGNDAVGDKKSMPAPMQVCLGMRSQVKWTHLSKEDFGWQGQGGAAVGAGSRALRQDATASGGSKGAYDFDRPSSKRPKR